MSKKILLIRFSSREAGNSAAISKEISKYYAAQNVNCFQIDSNTVKPCGNCDYECLQQGKECPNLTDRYVEVMDAICSADLVYFIVPNFCGYPCANFFVFNEQSVGYFNMDRNLMNKYMDIQKRFIIISNSEGNQFTSAMQQQVSSEPDILFLKSSKYGKRSIAGDMMDSESARADLRAFIERYMI